MNARAAPSGESAEVFAQFLARDRTLYERLKNEGKLKIEYKNCRSRPGGSRQWRREVGTSAIREPGWRGNMDKKVTRSTNIDLDKYRLRRFVERLVDMGEMEVVNQPVSLVKMSEMIEGNKNALLFKKAGPEGHEIAAKVIGDRKRIAAAFNTTPEKLHEYGR